MNFLKLNSLKIPLKNFNHKFIRRCYHFENKAVFGCENKKKIDVEINIKSFDEKQLLDEFRRSGHLLASINPLDEKRYLQIPENAILLNYYLKNPSLFKNKDNEVDDIESLIKNFKSIYCGQVGIEFMHITNLNEKEWIIKNWEEINKNFEIENTLKNRMAEVMIKSETFDEFLALKFPSVKRYGGEGCESMLVFFDELFRLAASTNPAAKINYSSTQNSKPAECKENTLLKNKITDIVIGMPHRGRLNFLSILNQFPEVIMFSKMLGKPEFNLEEIDGLSGDVLSHLYNTVNLQYNEQGNIINDQTNIKVNSLSKLDILENKDVKSVGKVHVSLLPNPSHLEAICPVVSGKVRSKLLNKKLSPYYENENENNSDYPVLSVQVHGDSSFSGQGIIFEQLQFSQFPHFNNYGTLHLVVNNQIGYTIEGRVRDGPLSYTTNVMKAVDCPVIHVNGSKPEELVKSIRFALKYREMFHKDILIDLVCYRKHGHNELDDPTFTNPALYKKINDRKHSIPIEFAINTCKMNQKQIDEIKSSYIDHLNDQLEKVKSFKPENSFLKDNWSKLKFPKNNIIEKWNTGINSQVLRYVGLMSMNIPKNFNLHKNLSRIFLNKTEKIKAGTKIDWALAECFAFGSLLYQGFNIRLSGQDVGRGTFSQRHMMLVDQKSDEPYVPLNALSYSEENEKFLKNFFKDDEKNKINFELDLFNFKEDEKIGKLEIANSILSEEAVLAFEYGFSLDSPNNLVIWEAQFGDFFNGAQIIYDTLISSGESKWGLQTGLVCLLPHGYDGAGPEHSSAKIERFLQLTNSSQTKYDSDLINLEIAYPSTPSQYFHLLRRQLLRNYRKPLIIFSPKTLLRHPNCISKIDEFEENTFFKKIIVDIPKEKSIKKIIVCSGKHYYTIKEHMLVNDINDVVIIRIEQLSPFPADELKNIFIDQFSNVKNVVWSQEEPRNGGAWDFINTRFKNLFNLNLKYSGRDVSSSPAVGIGEINKKEAEKILQDTFSKLY